MDDVKGAQIEYNKVLKEAAVYAQKDTETKKEFILRLKDKAITLFTVESRDLHELSSFMWNELSKYKFSIDRRYFQEFFDESEKRNYYELGVPPNSHVHEFVNGQCDCGDLEVNGIVYTPAPEPVDEESDFEKSEKEEKKSAQKKKSDPYQNEVTEYLQRIAFNCDNLKDLAKDMVDKYYADPEIAQIIEGVLAKDVAKLLENQKYIEAKIIHLGKLSDFRNKIGEFEKLKAILLEKTTFNLAKVAKMLRITPKHLSKNIIRNMDQYMANLRWFRSLVFTAQKDYKKGEIIKVDIADWYSQQIENKVHGLDMINPN